MREQKLGRGQKILGFDSLEEILAYQEEQEHAAVSGALPAQWEIGWDSYVIRFVDDQLVIFGHIFADEEPDETDEEALAELLMNREQHFRGYRYGQWFSEVVPEGEYGSAHVVSLWPISQTDFERARLVGWHLWRELAIRVSTEITEAVREHDSGNDHPEQHSGEDAPDVSGD